MSLEEKFKEKRRRSYISIGILVFLASLLLIQSCSEIDRTGSKDNPWAIGVFFGIVVLFFSTVWFLKVFNRWENL